MLLALVPGKRDGATCERLIRQVHDRTGGRTDLLITSDEHAPYETAIREVYGVEQPRPRRPGPGRPPKPGEGRPARAVLRDGAEAAREGPGRRGGADGGLRHAVPCWAPC